jgi:hypothetical protein
LNARLIAAAPASKGRRQRGCCPSIGAAPACQKKLVEYRHVLIYDGQQSGGGIGAE